MVFYLTVRFDYKVNQVPKTEVQVFAGITSKRALSKMQRYISELKTKADNGDLQWSITDIDAED